LLGFSYSDVLLMTMDLPSLLGISIDKIRERKEFYDQIGISQMMIIKTKYMIQSVSVSYARYMFYKSVGINIDMSNYKLLFVNQRDFLSKYKISNDELVKIYDYDKYMNDRGWYINYNTEMPGPISTDFNNIKKMIENKEFDKQKILDFKKKYIEDLSENSTKISLDTIYQFVRRFDTL